MLRSGHPGLRYQGCFGLAPGNAERRKSLIKVDTLMQGSYSMLNVKQDMSESLGMKSRESPDLCT
jgi:hypothetical protein